MFFPEEQTTQIDTKPAPCCQKHGLSKGLEGGIRGGWTLGGVSTRMISRYVRLPERSRASLAPEAAICSSGKNNGPATTAANATAPAPAANATAPAANATAPGAP